MVIEAGTGFFFLFFQRQYTYYEVQYVVVGEEQRPDRWYIMPRRICTELYVRWALQAYKGTVLVHICPEDGISTFFFPFFFITVLLSRPSHHTGTQDLCSLVYNSSMKNSMLITDHPQI